MGHGAADIGVPDGLDLVEEAFSRLRRAPATVWAAYYLGSAPFVLLLLYFWGDMANNAFAHQRLVFYTGALTVGFIWMKTWQSLAFGALLSHLQDAPPPRITWRAWWRTARQQTVIQSTGLFTLPLSLLVMAPLPYFYAFYQIAGAAGTDAGGLRPLTERAWSASYTHPRQNLVIMWLLSPLLVIVAAGVVLLILPVMQMFSVEWTDALLGLYAGFLLLILLPTCPLGMVVALNIAVALVAGPELLRRFLGVETVFTIGPMSMLTPTFLVIVCALTYLCLDPICKAAYALRYFYLTSVTTADDLLIRLRRVSRSVAAGMLAAAIGLAAASAEAQGGRAVDPVALDQSIDDVFQHRDYAWRLPRERPESDSELGTAGEGVWLWAAEAWQWTTEKLRALIAWWRGLFAQPAGGASTSSDGSTLRFAAVALTAVLLLILLGIAWRTWRQRSRAAAQVAIPLTPAPDLEDDSTTADALPEEGWLNLAGELTAQGEYRLAMRAYFFAGLARLAARDLVRIAGYKANREYARELQRVAHEEPQTVDGFWRGLRIFEAVWYGRHEPTAELLKAFRQAQREVGVGEV